MINAVSKAVIPQTSFADVATLTGATTGPPTTLLVPGAWSTFPKFVAFSTSQFSLSRFVSD